MAADKNKGKKSKKVKYRKVNFMLSDKELEFLKLCVMLDQTTINKFIKKGLRSYLEKYEARVKDYLEAQPEANQLLLFDFKQEAIQTSMLEEYEEFYASNEKE